MSDLISRSELLTRIRLNYNNHQNISASAIKDIIDTMPTAYSVDKVVEELKVIKEDALAEYNIGEYNLDNNIGNSIAENYRKDMNEGKCFAYDEAIEIVKQGIVSDDVCEWSYDTQFEFAKSKCGFIDTHRITFMKLKYCPYCGKKIKWYDR